MKALTIIQIATPIQAGIVFIVGILTAFFNPNAMPELIEFVKMYFPIWIGQVVPSFAATPIKNAIAKVTK
jgi:hypothetical protein